jgi:hypothetical protein
VDNPIILCANNAQEKDRWMNVLRYFSLLQAFFIISFALFFFFFVLWMHLQSLISREQTGLDHATLSEGSSNMAMEFEGAGQSEESDDDLFENWSFHVELANDWQPECKFIPEIPYIVCVLRCQLGT